jgi:hypothetical protein
MAGIMVRERRISRRCGAGGRCELPLRAYMHEGSTSLGEDHTNEKE